MSQHRYLAALPRGDRKVFLSWRLLPADAADAAFVVERRGGTEAPWERLSAEPVTDSTDFQDRTDEGGTHEYRVLGLDGAPSETVSVDSSAAASIAAIEVELDGDVGGGGIALGDLCNDGRIGYVLRMVRGKTVWIVAVDHGGAVLWQTDTNMPPAGAGWGRSTLHVPHLAWDVNGDGRTEVVFRKDKAFSGAAEHERTGPDETMVAVDAETGEIVWERPWVGLKHPRQMMTVGQLRGPDRPAAVVHLDGTYGDVVLTAVDGAAGEIMWCVDQARPAGHNLDVGDIDEDGVQEVICGGVCYNGDGTVRWAAEPFGHTDISKPARIDPAREGLQIWYAVEKDNPGVYFVDSRGGTIFKEAYRHAHYGWIARHTTKVPGLQPHTAEDARHEYGAADAGMRQSGHFPIFLPDGSHWLNLTDWQRKNFVPVHWDAGGEVVFITRKENKRIVRLMPTGQIEDLPEGKLPEGGRYGRNLPCADIVGDFRENIVAVDARRNRLMVLMNPTPARCRGYSPYDDFEYRHDRSQHGSGYYIYLSPPDTRVGDEFASCR